MTILMREREIAKENYEKGINTVIEKIVEIYREELNFDNEVIAEKLMKKFNLSREQLKKYL